MKVTVFIRVGKGKNIKDLNLLSAIKDFLPKVF